MKERKLTIHCDGTERIYIYVDEDYCPIATAIPTEALRIEIKDKE